MVINPELDVRVTIIGQGFLKWKYTKLTYREGTISNRSKYLGLLKVGDWPKGKLHLDISHPNNDLLTADFVIKITDKELIFIYDYIWMENL